ncbi:MAG: nucleoside hydrolase, partial [Planctomycetota bacterium]
MNTLRFVAVFGLLVTSQLNAAPRAVWIDADTANYMDDVFAILRALDAKELEVIGLSSSHWANAEHAPRDTVARSQALNEEILKLVGRESLPHPLGAADPLDESGKAQRSAAARAIITAAQSRPKGEKLDVVSLGAMTNLASAVLLEPRIAGKIRAHVMGLNYDDAKATWSRDEYNAKNDPRAVDVLFETPGLEITFLPGAASGQLVLKRDAIARRSRTAVGEFLLERWKHVEPKKAQSPFWDVALIEALIDPSAAFSVVTQSPMGRSIRVYTEIDQRKMASRFLFSLSTRGSNLLWPGFRGQNASGIATSSHSLPPEIGPKDNVVWRVSTPRGHSSPVVSSRHVFLTDETLATHAIDRFSGEVLWTKRAPLRGEEPIHRIGSLAQSSSATDGEIVVSFFGSSGLIGYTTAGERLWYLPMGPFNNDFGAGASPIIVGDRVILSQDHDEDSFVMSIDKRSGEVHWKTSRAEFPRGYATPVMWRSGGRDQVVVAGTLRVVGYDLQSGKEDWTVRGISRLVNITPTVGPDGTLYVTSWTSGGDANDRFDVPSFDDFVKENDKDGNSLIVRGEVPDGPLKPRFNQIDRDKSGEVTRAEYETMRGIMQKATNTCVAIRPGGRGDVSKTHVAWQHGKKLPYVPSPIVVDGVVFLAKKGGIVSSLDAKTGKVLKEGRVSAQGSYYASPVAGDGKIYLLNQRGDLSVISARAD